MVTHILDCFANPCSPASLLALLANFGLNQQGEQLQRLLLGATKPVAVAGSQVGKSHLVAAAHMGL